MNMERYYYGSNVEVQRMLREDGFDDGMINYLYENESGKNQKVRRSHRFFGKVTGTANQTPAFQN